MWTTSYTDYLNNSTVVQEGMVTERLEVSVKAENIIAGKEISL